MIIGIPKEIMEHEGRVGITPQGVMVLTGLGHKTIIQSQAGKESGYSDEDFLKSGALIEAKSQLVYQADLVIKVKEPQEEEYQLLRENGIIFAFLHLPANPKLVKVLKEKNITAIAYEGIQLENGERPILRPMSEVAGEVAIRKGIDYLKKPVKDIRVVILGAAGVVGKTAAKTAQTMGASVIALDLPGKLPKIQSDKYLTEISTAENIWKALKEADLLIGAVAIPGERAKKLVSRKMVSSMKPGSVIVDVAIDEGGCIETSRPTSHKNPTFLEEGVIHYCVKNIPGAIPKVSTPRLTSATLPYILEIAKKGLVRSLKENLPLARGIHIYRGKITNPKLAQLFNEKYTPLETLIR
jgi:alanine dehydrogenase